MTSPPHRAAWHREDDNDRSSLAVLGGTREARVGCRAFERRCEKHRGDASEARDRLQDHRIARVLLRLVRMNLAICFRMQDRYTIFAQARASLCRPFRPYRRVERTIQRWR